MQRVLVLCLGLLLVGCARKIEPRPPDVQAEKKPARPDVADLVKQLKDTNHEVRRKAASTLGEMGPEAEAAVPALGEMMFEDSDLISRDVAADALRNLGPKAAVLVPKLLKALEDDNDTVRNSAISSLGRLGMEAEQVVPALVKALGEGPPTRNYAATALGNFGPGAKAALPELHKALEDKDSHMRVAAAEAIWKVSQQSKEALPVLLTALKEKSPPPSPPRGGIVRLDDSMLVRWKAARVLADMGPAAKEAVPALRTAAGDRSPEVRVEAALALWKVDRQADAAVEALIGVLETADASLSQFPLSAAHSKAAEYLGEIGPPAQKALPVLQRVRADLSRSSNVREAAARAVEKIAR